MLHSRLRTHIIFAPTTSIGKTIASVLLLRASHVAKEVPTYFKPVGTFSPSGHGDDLAHVKKYVQELKVRCHGMWRWEEEKGPHLAGIDLSDQNFMKGVAKFIASSGNALQDRTGSLLIETAGGVHSPLFSGTSQLQAYRPLLPPVVLISSPQLGGISTTISAYESLLLRGYEIDLVLVWKEEVYRNYDYLSRYFQDLGVKTVLIDQPPPEGDLWEYYDRTVRNSGASLIATLQHAHNVRIESLQSAKSRAAKSVWFPFTQHSGLTENDITTISSAHGDFFTIFRSEPSTSTLTSSGNSNGWLEAPMLDASASWWTQGLGHASSSLLHPLAQAAGRYGHVIFSRTVHLPALQLAENLLQKVGHGWATRVFYSDDGSTGVEVALKMALRLAAKRGRQGQKVLGLQGGYHGDTIGAMDAAEPGTYNRRVEWYRGRGQWLVPPSVGFEGGKVVVRYGKQEWIYSNLEEVYDLSRRRESDIARIYRDVVWKELRDHGEELGCLLLEPLCLGAGGMIFVDPLFQNILVSLCRASSPPLPVIYDEVFVGLRRLGPFSSSSVLLEKPDVAVYGKLLTGGTLPLSVTVASEEVFDAFKGEKKEDALLHGHSYTAHPIGCQVAERALKILDSFEFKKEKKEWGSSAWSLWEKDFVIQLSKRDGIENVMALGTVLKFQLSSDSETAGYESNAAETVLEKLRSSVRRAEFDPLDFNIHARPLGDVLYFMMSLNTDGSTIQRVQEVLLDLFPGKSQ
ncbi:PLP-dependent transferase [Atractiella rhizophila]|nr:PLP-dependent transferase [Atractiella rhizophila]